VPDKMMQLRKHRMKIIPGAQKRKFKSMNILS